MKNSIKVVGMATGQSGRAESSGFKMYRKHRNDLRFLSVRQATGRNLNASFRFDSVRFGPPPDRPAPAVGQPRLLLADTVITDRDF